MMMLTNLLPPLGAGDSMLCAPLADLEGRSASVARGTSQRSTNCGANKAKSSETPVLSTCPCKLSASRVGWPHARADAKTNRTRAVGAAAGRRRWAESAGCEKAGHEEHS